MSSLDDDLDGEDWDVRETFAYFGRAFYMASVLEVGLAHAVMIGEFMMQTREQLKATKRKGIDQKQYEADAFMDKHDIAAAMKRAREKLGINDELYEAQTQKMVVKLTAGQSLEELMPDN